MKISTRGRYAIRVMLDLAEHNTGEYIPLMDIAKRQEISEKYLKDVLEVRLGQERICAFAERKGRRLSAIEGSVRIYDWKYSSADRGVSGTDSLSGT